MYLKYKDVVERFTTTCFEDVSQYSYSADMYVCYFLFGFGTIKEQITINRPNRI
jgi:hypothetical protein